MASHDATCPRCGSTRLTRQGPATICLSCLSRRLLGAETPDETPAATSATTTATSTAAPAPAENAGGVAPERLGPYEIIEEIGRGGMGIVYSAHHLELDRIVALKVIRRGEFATADDEARFLREAQSAAKLRHPGIVTLYETGRDGPHAWFAMEFLAGGDLARQLRDRAPTPREWATLVRQLALALAHAHGAGLIHRDLKPANILLDEAGEPHIADFGLATESAPGATLTQAGSTLGTPLYLAPEVVSGAPHSVASDLYALGAIFYLGLTGRPPHLGENPAAVLASIARGDPPAPRLLVPSLPADLEAVCLRALERDPAKRYHTAEEFSEELRRWLDGESTLARPLGPLARGVKWARRRPALAALWLLTVILAVGGVTAAVLVNEQRRLAESARVAAEAERDRAERAEGKVREQLRSARLAEAANFRTSRVNGARELGFAALREALAIRPGPDVQDLAVKLLVRPQVGNPTSHPVKHEGAPPLSFNIDPAGLLLAKHEDDYAFSVRRLSDDRELLRAGGPKEKWSRRMSATADGRWIVTRFEDKTLRAYRLDPPSPNPVWTLTNRPRLEANEHGQVSTDFLIDPTGPRVVIGHPDGGFTLHELETGRETGAWKHAERTVVTEYSPDGKWIATATYARGTKPATWQIHVVDTTTLTAAFSLPVDDPILGIAWSQDSSIVIASTGGREARWFSVPGGRWLGRLPRRDRDVYTVGWIPNGWESAIFLGAPSKAWSWIDAASGEEITGGTHGSNDPVLRADGRSFDLSDSLALRLRFPFEPGRGFRARRLPDETHSTEPNALRRTVAFTRDGKFVFGAMTSWVGLVDLTTGQVVAPVPGVTPGEAQSVWLDEAAGCVLIQGSHTGLQRVKFRREGSRFTFEAPVVLDAEKGFSLRDAAPATGALALVNWRDGGVRVLVPDGGRMRELRRWADMPAMDAAFSPDGGQLLINFWGDENTIKTWKPGVWDIATGEAVRRLDASGMAETLWSRDGKILVTSNGMEQTTLWDAATGKALPYELPPTARGAVSTFAMSPDSRWLAAFTSPVSGATDFCVHLLDLHGQEADLRLFPAGAMTVGAMVEFSPDGNRVYALDATGRFFEWDLPTIREGIAEFRVKGK